MLLLRRRIPREADLSALVANLARSSAFLTANVAGYLVGMCALRSGMLGTWILGSVHTESPFKSEYKKRSEYCEDTFSEHSQSQLLFGEHEHCDPQSHKRENRITIN